MGWCRKICDPRLRTGNCCCVLQSKQIFASTDLFRLPEGLSHSPGMQEHSGSGRGPFLVCLSEIWSGVVKFAIYDNTGRETGAVYSKVGRSSQVQACLGSPRAYRTALGCKNTAVVVVHLPFGA